MRGGRGRKLACLEDGVREGTLRKLDGAGAGRRKRVRTGIRVGVGVGGEVRGKTWHRHESNSHVIDPGDGETDDAINAGEELVHAETGCGVWGHTTRCVKAFKISKSRKIDF